jgi:hypothetical protein
VSTSGGQAKGSGGRNGEGAPCTLLPPNVLVLLLHPCTTTVVGCSREGYGWKHTLVWTRTTLVHPLGDALYFLSPPPGAVATRLFSLLSCTPALLFPCSSLTPNTALAATALVRVPPLANDSAWIPHAVLGSLPPPPRPTPLHAARAGAGIESFSVFCLAALGEGDPYMHLGSGR